MNDLIPALRDFIKVFTMKRIATLLIVAFALLLVCSPQYEAPTEDGGACDAACPFPRQPVINVPPIVITSIARENWSFTLMDEVWVSEESSNPDIKVVLHNESKNRMVLLIKEKTADMTLKEYGIESFKGFSEHGRIVGVTQTKISNQKSLLFEGRVGDDIFWSWNTVKDGFGYSLCCFYLVDADAGSKQRDECQAVADSLQID